MKEENKKIGSKNMMKTVKISTIILLIVLISMISFFGIYTQNKNQVSNKVKDYLYGMTINGARTIVLKLNEESKEIIKDSEGNVVESATDEEIEQKGYVKEQVANNSDEVKTEENYKIAKKIIEKRLKTLGAQQYNISLNEKTGELIIEVPENTNTDTIVGNLSTVGKFEIIDEETKEVLIDNSKIKSSDVLYNTTSKGTAVYLQIEFDKEGKKKLEEITKIYVKSENNNSTNETSNVEETAENSTSDENTNTENATNSTEGETTTTEKKITMKIDDEQIMSTSFDEPITTGKIQLSVGTATTDSSTLQDYITQARNVSVVLDSGKLPIKYDIEKNQYILSNITEQYLLYIEIAIAAIVAVGVIVLTIKFKLNGLLAGLAGIGLTALYVLLIRYVNVIMSVESIFGIITMIILNYIFTFMLLSNINRNIEDEKENAVNKATIETYKNFFNRIVPICIMAIVFCFIKWIPINSFGIISFWGLILIVIYNAVITRILLKIKAENN